MKLSERRRKKLGEGGKREKHVRRERIFRAASGRQEKEKRAWKDREFGMTKKGTQKEKPAETAGEPGPSGGRSETAGKWRRLNPVIRQAGKQQKDSRKTAIRHSKRQPKESTKKAGETGCETGRAEERHAEKETCLNSP